MERRRFLKTVGLAGSAAAVAGPGATQSRAQRAPKWDLHTHYYPPAYFERIRTTGSSEYSFDTDPMGKPIIKFRGARFFGIQPPMTDPAKRIEDMDRFGIDIEVVSLSTPNVFFAEDAVEPEVARMVNDAYAELAARHPQRFKGFASIPMNVPDAAVKELDRAIHKLKMNGVILLSNIKGKPLTDPRFRPFFEEADRLRLCILLHPMMPANAGDQFKDYVLGPIIAFPCDTTLAVARMCYDGMLRDFPNIRWIIAHLGGAVPYLMERMDTGFHDFAECKVKIDEPPSTYLKRLYYDTVTFSPYNLSLARDLFGADHLVMGSDYPHKLGSIERAAPSIENLNIPDNEKDTIFNGTALKILNNV
jgi:aminocarboxymuconate-semialdehyde decarboxylase